MPTMVSVHHSTMELAPEFVDVARIRWTNFAASLASSRDPRIQRGRLDDRVASTRSKRGNGGPGLASLLGHQVQLSSDRVLPQGTALKGAAEEKSTPETLTTACHAASWLARSWRCGWRCASIGPENFP